MNFVDDAGKSGTVKCRNQPVSVECPTSVHKSRLVIKRAMYRTSSANSSRDYLETDITGRVMELCPHQSTCRFDLAAKDMTQARTTQRTVRYCDNHIDISYSCQSSASAMIQPTNYHLPAKPGNINRTTIVNARLMIN